MMPVEPQFGLSPLVDPELGGPPTGPVPMAPAPVGKPSKWIGKIGPVVVLLVCLAFFALPLLAMARFAFQQIPVITLRWSDIFSRWTLRFVKQGLDDQPLRNGLWLSLKLVLATVALTMALLLPTTLWVHLRLPKLRSFVEFLTVLPYVIPPIALVAGIVVVKDNARWFLNSDYSLVPFYVVLALPFTFRSLDAGIRALDVKTLVDASRSLGAGWGTTLFRALIPNLRASIVSSSFLTATVVLGEFTIARVLLKRTLPTELYTFQQSNAFAGTGMALLILLVTTLLLLILTLVTRKRGAAQSITVF
ncbi:MAG: ABC transporter permease subunit [Ilumatobacteraceae bacterium]